MRAGKITYASVDDYIAQFAPEVQDILRSIRQLIRETAPEAVEKIAYDMPAYALHGSLVYFAAFKKHIGFYPASSGLGDLVDEVAPYRTGKGTLQFPLGESIPYALLRRLVAYRAAQNTEAAQRKARGKRT